MGEQGRGLVKSWLQHSFAKVARKGPLLRAESCKGLLTSPHLPEHHCISEGLSLKVCLL